MVYLGLIATFVLTLWRLSLESLEFLGLNEVKAVKWNKKKKSNGLLEEENTFLRTKRLASASAA